MPVSKKVINNKEVEVGNLIYGNANPKSEDYNSLADYIIQKDDIEIRIPWLMLNISNPAKKLAIDDFNVLNEIKHKQIENVHAGVYVVNYNGDLNEASMKEYTWDKWDMPNYHERLKSSYYIIKEAFKQIP